MSPTHFQLNPSVTTFQRKHVNEIKKCEEMERILGKDTFFFNIQFSSKAKSIHLVVVLGMKSKDFAPERFPIKLFWDGKSEAGVQEATEDGFTEFN